MAMSFTLLVWSLWLLVKLNGGELETFQNFVWINIWFWGGWLALDAIVLAAIKFGIINAPTRRY